MRSFGVYLDSDVLVSSCLSSTGAANLLLNLANITKFYTNIQEKELKIVFKRLAIDSSKLSQALTKCTCTHLNTTNFDIYSKYTIDPNDRHIIAGAVNSKTKFLITYNLKHFQIESLMRNLTINTLTPAQFLQYLRSTKQL